MNLRLIAVCFAVSGAVNCLDAAPELNSKTAATLAAQLANAEAKQHFQCQPFSAAQSVAEFRDSRWHWHAIAGHGKGDLEAMVSFSGDGSKATAEVRQLVNAREEASNPKPELVPPESAVRSPKP